MNCYYDRKGFIAGHILLEYYKYCQRHICMGCEKRRESSC